MLDWCSFHLSWCDLLGCVNGATSIVRSPQDNVLCGLLYNFSFGSSCPLVLGIIQSPIANASVEGCPLCRLKEMLGAGCGSGRRQGRGRAAAAPQPSSLPSVKAQLHLVGTCPLFFLTTVTSGVPRPTPFRQLSVGGRRFSPVIYHMVFKSWINTFLVFYSWKQTHC